MQDDRMYFNHESTCLRSMPNAYPDPRPQGPTVRARLCENGSSFLGQLDYRYCRDGAGYLCHSVGRKVKKTLFSAFLFCYIADKIQLFVCIFLRRPGRTSLMAAAVIRARGQRLEGVRESGDGNTISMPQLTDRKEWLAEFDVEILMLDG